MSDHAANPTWTESDDPDDPCWLCCSVEMGDDPMSPETWEVWAPNANGELARCHRVYRDLHPACAADMAAYGEDRP